MTTAEMPDFPSRARLGDDVTRYMRGQILTGAWPAHTRLVVKALTDHLGVSAMPVREALISLAGEGLVVNEPHKGFRVAAISPEDVEDTFRMHAFAAGLLTGRAAERVSAGLIDRLEQIQAEILALPANSDDLEVIEQVETLNHEFHRVIHATAQAPRLEWFIRAAGRFVPREFFQIVPRWVATTRAEHPAIIEALRDGDAPKARELAEAHVLTAGQLVVGALRERGQWEAPRN